MKTLGIVGGVASGKSAVAEMFADLGAHVISADHEGHLVLQEPQVIQAARERWGDSVLNPDGSLNRGQIATHVFEDSERGRCNRNYWNQVTHPRITERVRKRLAGLEKQGNVAVACLDAALLLEAGWGPFCDLIVFVDCPEPLRRQRALQRGWTLEHLAAREGAQMCLTKKRQLANIVVDNSGDFEQTYGQVRQAWLRLSGELPAGTEGNPYDLG